jgi:hypothetical protein
MRFFRFCCKWIVSSVLLCDPSAGYCFFPIVTDDELTITLAVDVTGDAWVYPFVIMPDGTLERLTEQHLTTTTGYLFPSFVFANPQQGLYSLGIGVTAVADSIVAIDTAQTAISSLSGINAVLRPSVVDKYSASPLSGETTAIFANGSYFPPSGS